MRKLINLNLNLETVKGVFVILTLMTILSVVQVCVAIVLVVGVKKVRIIKSILVMACVDDRLL